MTLQQHKDHLAHLEKLHSSHPHCMAIPKPVGAFYFGSALSLDEHIERYRAEINKLTGVH